MARQQVPELHAGWEFEDDPQDPGSASEIDQRHRVDWAKAQGNGHFMNQGKKKYYKLVKVKT